MKILTKIHLSGGNAWLIAVLRFDFGKLEVLVIVFVRSHREYNIYLHTEALDEVMYLFFWLDYPNYIRWGSVHVGDMKSLNTEAKLSMSKSWVAQKTNQILHYTYRHHDESISMQSAFLKLVMDLSC